MSNPRRPHASHHHTHHHGCSRPSLLHCNQGITVTSSIPLVSAVLLASYDPAHTPLSMIRWRPNATGRSLDIRLRMSAIRWVKYLSLSSNRPWVMGRPFANFAEPKITFLAFYWYLTSMALLPAMHRGSTLDGATMDLLADFTCGDKKDLFPVYRSSLNLTRFFQDSRLTQSTTGARANGGRLRY